jgi:CRP/FNR family transcriptional regulator, cyclic AMP receptor protein
MQRPWINTELAQAALFQGLSNQELRRVSALTTRLEAPAGRVLVRQGAPGREFIVLIDGEAQVVRDDRLIATRGPREHFGEMALVDRQPRSATVIASTPVVLEVIGCRDFHDLMHGVPDVAARIAATVAERRASLGAEIGDAARRESALAQAGTAA